jgi:predicted GNAT family N-acyltransferase
VGETFEIRKGYRHEEGLRGSFNKLAKETFGLDFEEWYQNGYWTEKYNPYSVVIAEQVVANVSVNQMEFAFNGSVKKYIQLGTVMTENKYRKQGYIARLMKEIEKDYEGMAEGYYLFANDSVTEFYPKFGYVKASEYQYSKKINRKYDKLEHQTYSKAQHIPMNKKENWNVFERVIVSSANQSTLEMKNNVELVMFYVTQFMQQDVYYIEEQQAFVIAEIEEGKLFVHAIYSKKVVDIDAIIEAFGEEIEQVILYFTPICVGEYEVEKRKVEDSTLFMKGNVLELFEEHKLMFPPLSHA